MKDVLISPEHLAAVQSWLGSGSINIFGLPFAGKDTHGAELAKLLNASLLGGGDILRALHADKYVQHSGNGKLFPTDEFLRIVTPFLGKPEFDGKPLILSSVGRWKGEEEGVLQATEASGHTTKAVIYLRLSQEIVHQRWKKSQIAGDRGDRADDAEHVLDNRIDEFTTKTLPVIEVYRKKGLLIEVNSDAEKHEVFENILARLCMIATTI
jgi:adenylate kinase